MNAELEKYVESEIIPRYRNFDSAHREDHARAVISRSLKMARHYDVDMDIVYAAAAFHDTGLVEGRETHHIASARIIREDPRLPEWFSRSQIDIIADAAEDHRASSKHEPRTIYGRIVAEADRLIDGDTIVRRAIRFGLDHYPELDKEEQFRRFAGHMEEKYSDRGYLRLWIPESPNAAALEDFRRILRSPAATRAIFERIWPEAVKE